MKKCIHLANFTFNLYVLYIQLAQNAKQFRRLVLENFITVIYFSFSRKGILLGGGGGWVGGGGVVNRRSKKIDWFCIITVHHAMWNELKGQKSAAHDGFISGYCLTQQEKR